MITGLVGSPFYVTNANEINMAINMREYLSVHGDKKRKGFSLGYPPSKIFSWTFGSPAVKSTAANTDWVQTSDQVVCQQNVANYIKMSSVFTEAKYWCTCLFAIISFCITHIMSKAYDLAHAFKTCIYLSGFDRYGRRHWVWYFKIYYVVWFACFKYDNFYTLFILQVSLFIFWVSTDTETLCSNQMKNSFRCEYKGYPSSEVYSFSTYTYLLGMWCAAQS